MTDTAPAKSSDPFDFQIDFDFDLYSDLWLEDPEDTRKMLLEVVDDVDETEIDEFIADMNLELQSIGKRRALLDEAMKMGLPGSLYEQIDSFTALLEEIISALEAKKAQASKKPEDDQSASAPKPKPAVDKTDTGKGKAEKSSSEVSATADAVGKKNKQKAPSKEKGCGKRKEKKPGPVPVEVEEDEEQAPEDPQALCRNRGCAGFFDQEDGTTWYCDQYLPTTSTGLDVDGRGLLYDGAQWTVALEGVLPGAMVGAEALKDGAAVGFSIAGSVFGGVSIAAGLVDFAIATTRAIKTQNRIRRLKALRKKLGDGADESQLGEVDDRISMSDIEIYEEGEDPGENPFPETADVASEFFDVKKEEAKARLVNYVLKKKKRKRKRALMGAGIAAFAVVGTAVAIGVGVGSAGVGFAIGLAVGIVAVIAMAGMLGWRYYKYKKKEKRRKARAAKYTQQLMRCDAQNREVGNAIVRYIQSKSDDELEPEEQVQKFLLKRETSERQMMAAQIIGLFVEENKNAEGDAAWVDEAFSNQLLTAINMKPFKMFDKYVKALKKDHKKNLRFPGRSFIQEEVNNVMGKIKSW